MSEICKICGSEKVEGKCPNAETHLKKMCLNCNSCYEDNGKCQCRNEENLKDATQAFLKSVPSGYEVENLSLKPVALKDPTKKCKRWEINKNIILAELQNF